MAGGAIMVYNIPNLMTTECVSALFKIYGQIEALHIDKPTADANSCVEETNKYCLIIFASKTAAVTAMKDLDNVPPLLFKISPYPPSTTRDLGSGESAPSEMSVTHMTSLVKPAYKVPGNTCVFHKDIPEPSLQGDCYYAVYAAEDFVSPHQFNLRLKISDACQAIIKQEMNQLPATRPEGWKAGPGDLIAVRYEESWRRGIVVKRTEVLVVYLPDLGKKINCTDKDVGLISSEITKYPVCAIQVSLAGVIPGEHAPSWTQAANNLSITFLNNDDIKVKILGRHESGRIYVDVVDKAGDLKTKLLLANLASPQQDTFHKFSHPVERYDKFVTITQEGLAQQNVDENDTCQVLEIESMDKVYIMKNSKVARFEEITAKLMDSNEQLKLPRPGFVCVAFDNDLAFRVRVLSGVESDRDSFKVHFLDQGFTKVVSKKDLYVLKGNLKDLPPLVDMVAIKCCVVDAKDDREVLDALRYSLVDDTKAFRHKGMNGEAVFLDQETNEDVVEIVVKRILDNRKKEGNSMRSSSAVALEQNRINQTVNASLEMASPRTSMQSRLSHRHRVPEAEENITSSDATIVVEDSVPATSKEKIEVAPVNRIKVVAPTAPVGAGGDAAVPIAETPVKETTVTRPRALLSDLIKSRNCKPAGEASKEPEKVFSQSENDIKKPKSVRFEHGEEAMTAEKFEEPVKAKIPEPFTGAVMYAESTEQFYVHRVSNDELYNEIIAKIQDSVEPVNELKVGMVCGVKVNESGLIYRGRIDKINSSATKVKIFLIDEGVRKVAEPKDLVKLKGKYDYEELPGLVKLYALAGKTWSKETNELFKVLVDNMEHFKVKPVEVVDGLIKVDLEDKNGSLIEVLEIKESSIGKIVQEPVKATPEATTNVPIQAIKIPEEVTSQSPPKAIIEVVKVATEEKKDVPKVLPKPFKCNVIWINGLKDFFVCNIEETKVDFLEIMEGIMGEVDSGVSKSIVSVAVGDLCIVEEDGLWYRGVVKKMDGDSVEVISMDEGRTIKTQVQKLQTLTKFQELPAQAIQVGLAEAKDQTPDMLDIFKQVISIDERILFLVMPKRFDGDVLMVDLIDIQDGNNMNVIDYMVE